MYSSKSFGVPTRLHSFSNIFLREADTPDEVISSRVAINDVEKPNFTNRHI